MNYLEQLSYEFLEGLYQAVKGRADASTNVDYVLSQIGIEIGQKTKKEMIDILEHESFVQRRSSDNIALLGYGKDRVEAVLDAQTALDRKAKQQAAVPLSNVSNLSFTEFRDSLLIALARDPSSSTQYVELNEIADQAGLKYDEGWIRQAALQFQSRSWVRDAYSKGETIDEGYSAEISAEGLVEAERLIRELQENSSDQDRVIPAYGGDVASIVGTVEDQAAETEPDLGLGSVPAADRFVSREDNQVAHAKAVEAVDAVLEAVRSDNEYGDEFPDERGALVACLEAGRTFLDATKIRARVVYATLLPPLKYVADNFAKGAIKALGAAAVAAVLYYIGPF